LLLSRAEASSALLVRLAPPVHKQVAPVYVATAAETVVKDAKDPAVRFNVEEGAVSLQVVCSATFITGQMVEGRGGAALAREVPRAITAPTARLVLAHAGVIAILRVVVVQDGRGGVREGLVWGRACGHCVRLYGKFHRRRGELVSYRELICCQGGRKGPSSH
jgi:hypothetical protein